MALSPITPRDRLQRLGDLARKTWRYWWLMAVFAVAGGALSLAFAMTRPKVFQSWTTLFYQERIQSQLLSPNREEVAQRNIGDRYRELLLARNQLLQIVNDPALDPYDKGLDPELKLDKLRQTVHFVARGAMAFRIEYSDSDPERAKKVTEKLTKLLQDTDEALRNEQAANTVAFATEQKEAAAEELAKREHSLNEFLAKNPAFVADTNAGQSEGALFRATAKANSTVAPRTMSVKERQLLRIQARLDAPPNAAPQIIAAPQTPERAAAEAAVKDAQREVNAAKRELEDVLAKYTDQHPSAIKAQERVAAAQQRLRQAEGAVPPEVETVFRPATAEDRAALERELKQLQAEIAAEQSRTGKVPETQDSTTQRVVQLETENSSLRRAVNVQREHVQTLADGVFRATIDANQKLAEQGGRLSIVDPAFKPVKPSGPGKSIFLMGGMVLFIALGLSFAVGLAVIDDRLYRRADLEQLGVPVLAVIPPAVAQKRKPKSKQPRAKMRPQTKGDVA
ncbi:MAG TPA: hypothetical protein VH165_04380 [Kofleriaceae bacterium]|jgi:uncharacterized protein involved in exopolysaccharide biosynthesis|nr:hypothetical protein [Kofleriaceae bacterium]